MAKELTAKRSNDKNFTILCIDDKIDNLKALMSILSENYNLILCKNADQGYKKAFEMKPDLILLDVVMPDESGFELIVRLKNEAEIAHIPVIFVTGLNEIESEEKGLKLGAVDYIQKPFHTSIVQARVNTHLETVRHRKLLERLAKVDMLTELPNRRKWEEDLNNLWEIRLKQLLPIVVGIADIDFFKRYNDSYGHMQGDIALRRVSGAIQRVLYKYNGGLYRCGGEEFYFFLSADFSEQAENILTECIEKVQSLNIKHEASLVANANIVTVSIGAVRLEGGVDISIKDALEHADQSLYKVKGSTRNGVDVSQLIATEVPVEQ